MLKPEVDVQVEELRLTQAQSAAAETLLIASDKKKGKAKKDIVAALPTQNGQGDSLSINSSILQVVTSTLCFTDVCAKLPLLSIKSEAGLAWRSCHAKADMHLWSHKSFRRHIYALENSRLGKPIGFRKEGSRKGMSSCRITGKLYWSWPRMHRGQRNLAAGIRATPRTPPSGGMRSL